jgi:hypothetical protein
MEKKRIKYLVIHCTDTPAGREVTPDDIRRWHCDPVSKGGRGWKQVGYASLIAIDGAVHDFIESNKDDFVDSWEITNGAAGYNDVSVHVCYAGGKGGDTRTFAQKEAMAEYVRGFLFLHPTAKVCGHCQLDNKKTCPSFDVPEWMRSVGVSGANIL